MKVRIRQGYIGGRNIFGMGSSEKWKAFLERNQGKLVEVETDCLFDNQYNVKSDVEGEVGYRIFDEHIDAIEGEVRYLYNKCAYCGTTLPVGQQCHKYENECIKYGMKSLMGRFAEECMKNNPVKYKHLTKDNDFDEYGYVRLGKRQLWSIRRLEGSELYYLHGNGSYAIEIANIDGTLFEVGIGYNKLEKFKKNNQGIPKYVIAELYKLDWA